MNDVKTLLKTLCEAPGVGGMTEIATVSADLLRPFVDEVKTDAMGNVCGILRGTDPDAGTVMLEAHLDEIGMIVTAVEDNGFIRREVIRDQTGKVASRKIWLCVSTYSAQPPINFEGTLPSKLMGPPIKIDGENNTYEYSLPNASAREEPAKPQRHTLTDAQMDEAIQQCTGTLAKTNHWSDSEREAVCKLVQEFYSPRAMNGKPPKHTTRGINGLFRKLAPNGRCSAKAAGEMLNEAIERGWTSVYPHEERGRAPARAAAPSVHLGAEL